jgi:hypothetical protein
MWTSSKPVRRIALLVVGATCLLWVLWPKAQRHRPTSPSVHPSTEIQAPVVSPAALASVAGSILGTVRGADAQRVSSAHVCATDVGSQVLGQPILSCVETDSQGRYEIPVRATGGYLVDAEATDFLPGPANGGQPVFLVWGEKRAGVDIMLSRGGAKLAGLVRDATGGPIAGATVRMTRFTPPHNTVAVQTNHDGQFVLWPTRLDTRARG